MKHAESDHLELASQVGQLLEDQGQTIAVAEATGCGLIGYLLTGIPSSSRYYLGGLSPYARQGKVRGLGMSESLLDEKGSVSSETALEMAHRVRDLFDSDLGVAETGIAGPGGGTLEKPVGLFYVAVAAKDGRDICQEHRFEDNREENRWQAARATLELVAKFIEKGTCGIS
ncbi:MAG: CinA family protein [Dehalococcoidia bacterium]